MEKDKSLREILEKLRIDVMDCVFDYQAAVGKDTARQIEVNDKCNKEVVPKAQADILKLVPHEDEMSKVLYEMTIEGANDKWKARAVHALVIKKLEGRGGK